MSELAGEEGSILRQFLTRYRDAHRNDLEWDTTFELRLLPRHFLFKALEKRGFFPPETYLCIITWSDDGMLSITYETYGTIEQARILREATSEAEFEEQKVRSKPLFSYIEPLNSQMRYKAEEHHWSLDGFHCLRCKTTLAEFKASKNGLPCLPWGQYKE